VKSATILAVICLVASLLSAKQVGALPLCEGEPGVECGEDVIADNNVVINGLNVGVTSACDANSAIIAFQNALREFNDARTDRDNTFLPIAERCNEASSEDRQAFNQIAKGVSGAVKISASKFKVCKPLTSRVQR